jgi:hypothetical protein
VSRLSRPYNRSPFCAHERIVSRPRAKVNKLRTARPGSSQAGRIKKAFDNAKAANQFASSSSYFFLAAFFFVAFFFIGMVCVPPMERFSLVLEKLQELLRLLRWPTYYHKILGSVRLDVKNICMQSRITLWRMRLL